MCSLRRGGSNEGYAEGPGILLFYKKVGKKLLGGWGLVDCGGIGICSLRRGRLESEVHGVVFEF